MAHVSVAHDETPGGTLEEPGHRISASVKKKRYSAGDERWKITLYGPRTLIDEIHAETYEGREWSGGGEYRSGDPENCYYHLGLGPPPAPYPRRKPSDRLRDGARIGLRGARRGVAGLLRKAASALDADVG